MINLLLCQWLEATWDHRLLIWSEDHWADALVRVDPSIVLTPFNPTAENMAIYLLHTVGPKQLAEQDCVLYKVIVEETRKCSATAILRELSHEQLRQYDAR